MPQGATAEVVAHPDNYKQAKANCDCVHRQLEIPTHCVCLNIGKAAPIGTQVLFLLLGACQLRGQFLHEILGLPRMPGPLTSIGQLGST